MGRGMIGRPAWAFERHRTSEREKTIRACPDEKPMNEGDVLPGLVLPIERRDNCLGPPSAKYSLVEYGDYTSLHCRHVLSVVQELVRELRDDLCFVFRNFPQPNLHPYSRPAAEAAEAAGLQGKFWLMHDRLFEHQDSLSDRVVREIARGLPVEMEDFEREPTRGRGSRERFRVGCRSDSHILRQRHALGRPVRVPASVGSAPSTDLGRDRTASSLDVP